MTYVNEAIRQASEIAQNYSRMSALEKLNELKKLHEKEGELEKALFGVSTKIAILEGMEDVIDEKIRNDSVAVAFLQHLRKNGDVAHDDLMLITGKEHNAAFLIVMKYAQLLKRAGIVGIVEDRNHTHHPVYTLTEKGRSFKYE